MVGALEAAKGLKAGQRWVGELRICVWCNTDVHITLGELLIVMHDLLFDLTGGQRDKKR